MTPTEVQTSVSRCLPSAREGDRAEPAAGAREDGGDAAVQRGRGDARRRGPTEMRSSGCGARSRPQAATPIHTAATKIRNPSAALAKYSALRVAVGMPLVGRPGGDGERPERDDRRDEVDDGLGGVREETDGLRQLPGRELEKRSSRPPSRSRATA